MWKKLFIIIGLIFFVCGFIKPPLFPLAIILLALGFSKVFDETETDSRKKYIQ